MMKASVNREEADQRCFVAVRKRSRSAGLGCKSERRERRSRSTIESVGRNESDNYGSYGGGRWMLRRIQNRIDSICKGMEPDLRRSLQVGFLYAGGRTNGGEKSVPDRGCEGRIGSQRRSDEWELKEGSGG
ncbi:hypothetical protein L2E82_29997 [Cichorium intybus]|uniref:Uncharacterized protein n=1 Tax=Cichorium intybus TaxID=13427 RepID=A0ACB9CZG6_CICIN|nr:hypothetical protein L2E82_29997 [Cichorium intybus]